LIVRLISTIAVLGTSCPWDRKDNTLSQGLLHCGTALAPHQRQEVLQRLANGEVQADLARSFNVSQATISRLQA
jgi:DNA-binding NarL/FixJ family response regulator